MFFKVSTKARVISFIAVSAYASSIYAEEIAPPAVTTEAASSVTTGAETKTAPVEITEPINSSLAAPAAAAASASESPVPSPATPTTAEMSATPVASPSAVPSAEPGSASLNAALSKAENMTIVDTIVDNVIHPWVFGGIDLGLATVTPEDDSELSKKTNYYAGKGVIDFYFPNLTLEGGMGMFDTTFKSKSSGSVVNEHQAVRTLFLEGAARYRSNKYNLEIGVVNHILFGTATDFGPVEGANKNNDFIGFQAIYQPPRANNWRLSFDYLHDYTIKTRQVSFVMLGLQFGFPLLGKTAEQKVIAEKLKVEIAEEKKVEEEKAAIGRLLFSAKEATSGKPWNRKKITYSIKLIQGGEVNGEVAGGKSEKPIELPAGIHKVVVTVGEKVVPVHKVLIGADQTAKIDILLGAAGLIQLRQTFDIGVINFESSKAIILPDSFAKLTKLADLLKTYPQIAKFGIEGHTDSSGPAQKNIVLSKDRAVSVVKFLVEKGVEESRLEPQGFGPNKPLVDNSTPEGRAVNRRVEFVIKAFDTID